MEEGFEATARFLNSHFVFTQINVPYNTQLVPLSALYVELGRELDSANARRRLDRWYWCGVFGEAYGSAVESQYARDLIDVPEYIRNGTEPTLIAEANFAPARLITLGSRRSAAYKGLYAMQMKNGAADWRTSQSLTLADWYQDSIDIHHIFPKNWCEQHADPRVPAYLYNSIINKTPIDATTNKIIGGRAPSQYLQRLRVHNSKLSHVLQTHWLNPNLLESDRFADCFVARGQAMLDLIGEAMGRSLGSGREVFTQTLQNAGLYVAATQLTVESGSELEAQVIDDEDEFDDLGDFVLSEFGEQAADD